MLSSRTKIFRISLFDNVNIYKDIWRYAECRLQKRLSRKKKGSNGWLKVVKLVGKQHKKVANKGQVLILKQPMIYYQKLILLLTKA